MAFLYSRWDESFGDGTVSGTVSADYLADWLLDPSPFRPVHGASGLSLTATAPAARVVGLVALLNTNVAGAVTVGGHTVPAPVLGPDGIYLNPFVSVASPASQSSLALSATGTPAIIGGLWAGVRRQLERNLLVEPLFEMSEPFEWEPAGLPPYDDGLADRRRLMGRTIVSDTGLNEIEAWYRSTRKGTLPSLIVPRPDINDAWLVTFSYTWSPYLYHDATLRAAFPGATSIHRVHFEFVEIPRLRW